MSWKTLVRSIFGSPPQGKRKPGHERPRPSPPRPRPLPNTPSPTKRKSPLALPPPTTPAPPPTAIAVRETVQPAPTAVAISKKKQLAPREKSPLKQLLEAVQLLTPLITQRSSLPILACCLLRRGEIAATDLEISLIIPLPWLDLEPVYVPALRLLKALRTLTGELRLEKRGFDLIVNEAFRIPGLDPSEGPALIPHGVEPASPSFVVPERWEDLVPAMPADLSRLQLAGVHVDLPRGQCVASDGHRLHMVGLSKAEPRAFQDDDAASYCIVPWLAAKLVAQLRKKGPVTGRFYTALRQLSSGEQERLKLPASHEDRKLLERQLRRPNLVRFTNFSYSFQSELSLFRLEAGRQRGVFEIGVGQGDEFHVSCCG